MGRNLVETIMGAVVLLVAAGFVYMASKMADVETVKGYGVTAAFFKIGGLNRGADVRIAGIKVGSVIDNRLDAKTYDAVVSMSIDSGVRLPKDTVASIASGGLLGDKYVRLEPGAEGDFIEPGGKIAKTRDFRSLEDQVGEIIFLATGGNDDKHGGQ